MLEDAERQGRTAPTTTERLSAIVNGLGTRLDGRLALGCALLALAVAAVAGVAMVWANHPLAAAGLGWILSVLTVAVSPSLIAVGAVALARWHALLSEPRALALVALALPALVLAVLAQLSYGIAFDAADRDVPVAGLATAWPWLFGAACVLGACAVAIFIDALMRRARLHPAASVTLAVLAGVMLAPTIGLSLLTPYASAIGAAGLALLTLIPERAARPVPHSTGPEPAPHARTAPADIPQRTSSVARMLAWIAAIGSTVGIVYALTGSRWSLAGSADATAVMGQGITIALMSAVPLLAAIGVLVAARARTRPAHTWGPLLLVALSVTAVTVAYLNAPAWYGMAPGFGVASALGGAAIAWWLTPRLRGPARTRAAIGVLIGIGYAAFLGMLVAPILAFVIPLLAAAFAIWAPGRARPGTCAPDAATNPLTPGTLPSTR
ncbi:hypothetical protein BH09ACT3_BH09ACT3_15610 [soil metagenome]